MINEYRISEEKLITNIAKITKIPEKEVTMDLKLYSSNMVSSLSILEIMSFVEKEYKIVILPEDLIDENFGNLRKLKDLIERKIKTKINKYILV